MSGCFFLKHGVYEPLVEEVSSQTVNTDTCAVIYESDADFGPVEVVEPPV